MTVVSGTPGAKKYSPSNLGWGRIECMEASCFMVHDNYMFHHVCCVLSVITNRTANGTTNMIDTENINMIQREYDMLPGCSATALQHHGVLCFAVYCVVLVWYAMLCFTVEPVGIIGLQI